MLAYGGKCINIIANYGYSALLSLCIKQCYNFQVKSMTPGHCPDTLAPSYSEVAAREAKAVASEAESKKRAKYAHLNPSHHFVPMAVETLGAFGPEALTFIRDLGRRIMDAPREPLPPPPPTASRCGCSCSEGMQRPS